MEESTPGALTTHGKAEAEEMRVATRAYFMFAVGVECWIGVGKVEQGDKVLIYLLPAMFLLTCDIRFSLHSDRAEGKSNPYLQTAVPRAAPPRYQHPRCDQQTLVCIQT